MIAIVQRVSQAAVEIEAKQYAAIKHGFLVLLGVTHSDTEKDAQYISKKIAGLRVFADSEDKMNLDIQNIDGDILLISQFTLYAQTKKGNRPSFIDAARPEVAIPLYEKTIEYLELALSKKIKTGIFGADMKVSLVNDGPVTIIIDSKD